MEKRAAPRIPFVASAEISEAGSRTKMTARISELSLQGCYVDMLNTLPEGTMVCIKIFTTNEVFEGTAVVVYAHQRLGMGLAFREVKPEFGPILKGWLLKAETTDRT